MSQSINSLPVGALVKDTGTTAKYSISAGYQMIWRVIGKNHDATNSVTLESAYAIEFQSNGGTPTLANYDNLTNLANTVNFSSELSAKLKTISKIYVKGKPTAYQRHEGIAPYITYTTSNVSAKVHLIGTKEVTGENHFICYLGQYCNVSDGSQYAYYSNYANNKAIISKNKLSDKTTFVQCGLRQHGLLATTDTRVQYIYVGVRNTLVVNGTSGVVKRPSVSTFNISEYCDIGSSYVAPLICIPNDIRVSDTTDSDGAYTIVWNTPPRISTPSTDLGDRTKAFSTTFQVADDEGDTVSATINLDSTTIQTIASVTLGADNTISIDATTFRNLALGSHTISIIANDGTESVTKTISFQKVSGMGISGSDGDLGNKWMQPTITYQVYDDNDLQVDITEKIDGEIVKELEDAPLNTDITFDMGLFNALTPEEQHTLKIEAVNADESTAERTWTFTKLYQYLEFYTDTVETDISAERIYVVLDYDKTNNPEIQVLVCNDAGGTEWHYEDATEDVLNGQPHTFHYTPAEGTEGVSVMVRLIKNENTERVYFNNIGFTFS